MESKPRIKVVLVETSHPGNIGATARAMKTMGLSELCLVRPKRFPCAEATARAAGADDVLYEARVCDSIEEAVADCVWVVATSARSRRIRWPVFTPHEAAQEALRQVGSVGLLFGREHSGLTNRELDHCQALVQVPSNREFSSLNIACAVQILAYELYLADSTVEPERDEPTAADTVTSTDMEGLYKHVEEALVDIGYLDPGAPKLLMRRVRRLLNRARPDRAELNILRGIFNAAQKRCRRSPHDQGQDD